MLETIIALIVTIIALIGTIIICVLSAHKEEIWEIIYERFINNEKFKEKAKFIYSVIDYDKYVKFVELNETIENPNELIISYSVVDSDSVKINVYNIGISDIAFVF